MDAPLSIYLFGSPRFSISGQPIARKIPARALEFAAHLLLHREAPVSRETIAFKLWPDLTEEEALGEARRALYVLRQYLPDSSVQWIATDRRNVVWNTDAPYLLDVQEYERLCNAGSIAEAAALYTGDLLETMQGEWLLPEREHLRLTQLRLLENLTTQLRERGSFAEALSYARRALRIDPWNEAFVREAMMLRALGGDRSGALHDYRSFQESLKREMDALPAAETATLFEKIRSGTLTTQRVSRMPAPAKPAPNLPTPISTFVGRSAELARLNELIFEKRLVTLVGPGGVGKTRLALRAAELVCERFSDGTLFLDLTPVPDWTVMLRSIAFTLRLEVLEGDDLMERVTEQLRSKHILLLFDNCEHLTSACARAAERILLRCPNVSILATSRERLHVTGEVVFDVQPFSSKDAADLFYERASALQSHFARTDENAPIISSICQRLDGIALAIELAAGRVRHFTLAQIGERLDDRFAFLEGSVHGAAHHQQTLREAIDWSYDLLTAQERRILDPLSAFAGTCSLEAIRDVCADGGNGELPGIVEALAEKSLLVVVCAEPENEYQLLESVRAYLIEKLHDRGLLDEVRGRHLKHFTQFAEMLEPQLTQAGQDRALAALTRVRDNLRTAFSWQTENRDYLRLRLRLAAALRWFYWFHGLFDLARQRLSETLNAYGFEMSLVYARALSTYGYFTLQQGDMDGAITALLRALEACPPEAEREYTMIELQLGLAHAFKHDDASASRHLRHGLEEARRLGDPWLLSYALALEGLHAGQWDRRDESIRLLTEALELTEQIGESFQGTFWLLNLAVQQYYADPSSSIPLFLRCTERSLRDNNLRAVAGSLEGLGWCLQRRGHAEEAAHLLGAADELRKRTSQPLLPQWHPAHDAVMQALGPLCESMHATGWGSGADAVRARRFYELYRLASSLLEAETHAR
jgi:predicted ATPase/DNA-binding SARP family transcriptional activator